MRLINQESIKGKLIYSLGMGVGILIGLSNKRASYNLSKTLIKEIFGLNADKKNIRRDIYRLREQKLIKIEASGKEHRLTLTEDGKKIFLRFNYEKLKISQKKIWDMQWRMVLFDIPDKKKSARDAFRYKMKKLGCVRFNHSVWIYPYPCEKEINFIANYWDVGKYVHFAIVSKITNEEILRKHFKI